MDRRNQLLQAAASVFAQKGYRQASVSDVIAQADVARGTFYLYFRSKHEIFVAVIEALHRRITQNLDPTGEQAEIGTDARAFLVSQCVAWLEFFAANREAAMVAFREAAALDPRFNSSFTTVKRAAVAFLARPLQHLQDLGHIRARVPPDRLAQLQLGMLDALLQSSVLSDPETDIQTLSEQLVDVLWNGIHPE